MSIKENSKQIRKYFIPIQGKRVIVTPEVYLEYYRPIWRVHDHARRKGQCGCSKWQLCQGDCGLCNFRTAGNTLSLEYEQEMMGDVRPDLTYDLESIVMDSILLEELLNALEELDPDSRRICELIRLGKSERDIAAEFGIRQSTLNYRKRKLMDELHNHLKDFI